MLNFSLESDDPLGNGGIFCVLKLSLWYNGITGGKLSKNSKRYQLWIGLALLLIAAILIIIVVINVIKGEESGDVKIGGEAKVTGIVCRDTTLVHPATTSVSATSHTNTITANFRDDKLSSISLIYEGDYGTEEKAKTGESFAKADYSLTLTDQYGEKADVFSVGFSVDGPKMQMVQTARDISKINEKTVTYFLLDRGTSMAKSLDSLKKQYEAKGFSCEISE